MALFQALVAIVLMAAHRALAQSISTSCRSAVLQYASVHDSSTVACTDSISRAVLNASTLALCLKPSTAGVDCMNPLTLMALSSRNTVEPRALRAPSACALCPTLSLCRSVYVALTAAAAGLEQAGGSTAAQAAYAAVFAACSAADQSLALTVLFQQSEVTCGGSSTEGRAVASTGYITGALDMRSLVQCGTCGVVPCTPGMYCAQNRKPEMCPEGFYCPTPASALQCPAGNFCPLGSIAPQECRGVAAGSCPAGSSREVVWVPLFVAVLLGAAIVGVKLGAERGLLPVVSRHLGMAGHDEGISGQAIKSAQREAGQDSARRAGVTIGFSHLRLVTGTNVRLTDVTGTIRPGRLTAIIGGSGAGKTTLMSVLLGYEKQTAGTVVFSKGSDGEVLAGPELQNQVGFVPQTDVMLRVMTVEQLLVHSARSRLPATLSSLEIMNRVENVMAQLNLTHLRHTVVGGESTGPVAGGLSPGDRKRVNIAHELVAEPSLLFLDEPTTGLDASSAMNVATLVRNVAASGITCVAVVHQPRGEVYAMLDDIIVLVKGGKVAYHGPAKGALQYFAQQGFRAQPRVNKTDFLLDVVSGTVPAESESATNAPVDFSALWEQEGNAFLQAHEGSLIGAAQMQQLPPQPVAAASARRPTFLMQTYLVFKRAALQRVKGNYLFIDLSCHLLGGVIIGIVTSGGPLLLLPIPSQYKLSCPPGGEIRCNSWLRMMAEPATFYWTMTLGSLAVPPAVRSFGAEKEVFLRECRVGASSTAYYLGKLAADSLYFAFTSFFFLAPLVAIAPWRGPVHEMYAICLCISLFISSLGNALALLFQDPDAATLVGVIIALLMNLFGGFVPQIGNGAVWAFTRWTARAIVAVEVGHGQGIQKKLFNQIIPKEHDNPDYGTDLGNLLLTAIATHAAAYILLLRRGRAAKPGKAETTIGALAANAGPSRQNEGKARASIAPANVGA